jgi:hypothetical protein
LRRCKTDAITVALLMGCVIHGDLIRGEIREVTYLVIAIIVLRIVKTLTIWAKYKIIPGLAGLRL